MYINTDYLFILVSLVYFFCSFSSNLRCGFLGAVLSSWTSVSPTERQKDSNRETALIPAATAVAIRARTKNGLTKG